jgi:hypothetical protein
VTDEEYAQAQQQVLMMAHIVRGIPLAAMLNAISRADSIGPIVDPTLWMHGHQNMHKIERLASALRKFQAVVEEVMPGMEVENDG